MSEEQLNRLINQLSRGETSPELKEALENSAEAMWDATTGRMFPELKGKYKEHNPKL